MPQSVITVQSNRGNPITGKRVVLVFKYGKGQTEPEYTDRLGRAIIDHEAVGDAEVYVDHKKRDTFRFPGNYPITIR